MNRKISVSFSDATSISRNFEGLRELIDFLKSERDFWQEKSAPVPNNIPNPHPYLNANNQLSNVISQIESWSSNIESWDENTLNQQLRNLFGQVQLHSYWLWSGHPYVNHFIECHKKYGANAATAFLDLITRNQSSNITKGEYLKGYLLAYEYLNQDSDLTKRSKSEKASLAQLRNKLDTTTTQLISEVESFKDSFTNWDTTIKSDWQDWLTSTSTNFDDSQKSNKDQFDEYIKTCKAEITNLENTYQEKLRLEKPAKYWNKAAYKYGVQAGLFLFSLVCLVVVGLLYGRDFYIAWLSGLETKLSLNTVQGVVLFGVILAIYGFLIRVFSRLTFSSYHLMRDADERELLTYLYLSLSNENQINESSRDIVLQALFSRSETGLLNSESGPKMPSVADVFSKSSTER